MQQSEHINEIAAALCTAQGELPAAIKGSVNPHLKNRYADINAIYEAIREVLAKNGLCVVQTMLPTDGSMAHVRTTLAHKSGQWFAGECTMPIDRQGGAQGIGSAITYARRYSLAAIVGVVTEEDDDANAAQGRNRKAPSRQREPAPQQSSPTAPLPEGDAMTEPQRKKLFALARERLGWASREDILAAISGIIGREISSSTELTRAEACKVIDHWENAPVGEALPKMGDFPWEDPAYKNGGNHGR